MKIDRVELPSGGWIDFSDPADLTHPIYRRIQSLINRIDVPGEVMAETLPILAVALISAWEVPYIREKGRIIPSADPTLLDGLKIGDVQAMDRALTPVMLKILHRQDLGDGDPQTPQPPSGG